MKQKVALSTYCKIITVITLAVIITIFVVLYYRTASDFYCWTLLGVICVLCVSALVYSPQSVQLSNEAIIVNTPIRHKAIRLYEVSSVGLCSPTMSEKRIFGSGGFCGYWGYFYEPSIGRYFAYYGKASDCFLVTLKSGKKYLLGCENASIMVTAINERLADLR